MGNLQLYAYWQGQFLQVSSDLILGRLTVNGYSYWGHNVAFNGSAFKSINGGSGALIGLSGAGGFNIDFASGAAAAGDTYPTYATKFALTNTGAATFSSSVTTSNGIISNYGRINGRLFVTNEADYGDMVSTAGMVSIGYYPAGQEATIRSRNYSTSTNTKLAFDASQFAFGGGHLLIGTTTDLTMYSAWDNGVTRIAGGGLMWSYTGSNNFMISNNYYINTAGNETRYASGGASNIYFTDGALYFRTVGSGAAESTIVWNNPLTLTATGNALVGTTTDVGTYKLQVAGQVRATGAITQYAGVGYYVDMNYLGNTYNFGSGETTDNVDFKIAGGGTFTTGGGFGFWTQAGGATPIQRMRITSGGNVLIGTTTATSQKLTVNSATAAGQVRITGAAPTVYFTDTVTDPANYVGLVGLATATNNFFTGTASGDFVMYNQVNGYKLFVVNYSGGVYLTSGATSWTANSDIRLKNINSHIENAVEKLSTLQAINFSYKDDKFKKQNLGLIAQEVEKIFPELIDKNNDGMLGVRYTELVPVLIKAIQELKLEIETLKNK
jgi:hypothetical protein